MSAPVRSQWEITVIYSSVSFICFQLHMILRLTKRWKIKELNIEAWNLFLIMRKVGHSHNMYSTVFCSDPHAHRWGASCEYLPHTLAIVTRYAWKFSTPPLYHSFAECMTLSLPFNSPFRSFPLQSMLVPITKEPITKARTKLLNRNWKKY